MSDDQAQGKTIAERLDAVIAQPQAAPVEEKQVEPMPSSEQKPAEEAQAPEVATQDDLALPENVSERTREQFEKLKARLKETEAKLASNTNPETQTEYGSSVLESLYPSNQPPQVDRSQYNYLDTQAVNEIRNDFIDEQGNVDIHGLNRALKEQNELAKQAMHQAQQAEQKLARFEENQQTSVAHTEFPEIDPLQKDKFNPKLYEAVRDRLLRNMWEGKERKDVNYLRDVTKQVIQEYGFQRQPKNEGKIAEEAVQKYKETQSARNQGPLEMGRGQERSIDNLEDLRERTRRGDSRAVAARLKALGI